jgi:hypothetical protein
MRHTVSAPLRLNSVAALPGHLHQGGSTSYWSFPALAIDSEFITFWYKFDVLLLDTREDLCDIAPFLACHQSNDIIHRPLMGGLVDPDAVSEIDSGDAHGA